jgi:hypothetical protein
MPISIRSANPLSKKVFPDDSTKLNRLYQALQLAGNSEEHYHKIRTLAEGKLMRGFSMSKTCERESMHQ